MTKTVALLGGSFNPPHEGHIHLAQAAARHFAALGHPLDEIRLLVAVHNPDKPKEGMASFADRLEMCRLALADAGNETAVTPLAVSDAEKNVNPTGRLDMQSADILKVFMENEPQTRFVWMMGADNIAGFHTWEGWEWMLETLPLVLFTRPKQVETLFAGTAGARLAEAVHAAPKHPFTPPAVHIIDDPHPAVATEVRNTLAEGVPGAHLSPSVATYIREKSLYGY